MRRIILGLLVALALASLPSIVSAQPVNSLVVVPGATGVNPSLSATGSDTNISITLTPKGAGGIFQTQTTAPTCAMANGIGGALAGAGQCGVTNNAGASKGSDQAMRILIGANNQNAIGSLGQVLVITLGQTYTDPPACTASYDSPGGYGYYIYGITPSTTTVLIKLGKPNSVITPAAASFSPGDNLSVICGRIS